MKAMNPYQSMPAAGAYTRPLQLNFSAFCGTGVYVGVV